MSAERPSRWWRRGSAADRLAHRADTVRRRRWLGPLVAVAVVAVVAGLGWLVFFSSALVVREVRVVGAQKPDVVIVRQLGEEELGRPLALVDTGEVSARVLTHPAISRAAVERVLPGTLRITVTTREPVLVVRNSRGRLEVMDRAGVVFRHPATPPADVPLVQSTAGQVGPEGVSAALSVVKGVPESLRVRISGVTVGEADHVTFRVGATQVVWGTADRPELKSELVETLLRTRPRPSTIDVSAPDTPVTR